MIICANLSFISTIIICVINISFLFSGFSRRRNHDRPAFDVDNIFKEKQLFTVENHVGTLKYALYSLSTYVGLYLSKDLIVHALRKTTEANENSP